jgi:hypothetical protein
MGRVTMLATKTPSGVLKPIPEPRARRKFQSSTVWFQLAIRERLIPASAMSGVISMHWRVATASGEGFGAPEFTHGVSRLYWKPANKFSLPIIPCRFDTNPQLQLQRK